MRFKQFLASIDQDDILRRLRRDYVPIASSVVWLLIVLMQLFYYHYFNALSAPVPNPQVAGVADLKFDEERALRYLHGLTSMGSRIVGSTTNRDSVVKYIWTELEKMKENHSISTHKIGMDLQTAGGSFDLDFLGGFTNVYDNINNIIVELKPFSHPLNRSILINCHYDTFLSTEGASDDAVSCATMMAVLHSIIAKGKFTLGTGFYFLFNGAEETILQGSHAFVTSHQWFKHVTYFINLEAAGAGGKQLLFQITPRSSWMVKAYQFVPYPFASSLAQEVFQTGVIQSDTDFRIFRDFGMIRGMDIAYMRNGYFYHTRHDTPDKIARGCIQRAGENLLTLLKSMHDHISSFRDLDSQDNLVFFDLLGYDIVAYSLEFLLLLNPVICLLFHLKLFLATYVARQKRAADQHMVRLMLAVGVIVCSWAVSLASCVAVALFLDSIGCPMSWFNNTWMVVGLYIVPTAACTYFGMIRLKRYWVKTSALEPLYMESLVDDAVMFIVSSALLFASYLRLASSFLLLIFLASMLLKSLLLALTCFNKAETADDVPIGNLFFHMCLLVQHHLMSLYYIEGTITTFVPLMGRAGPSVPPDVVIGSLVSLTTSYYLLSHLSMVFLLEIPKAKQVFGFVFFSFLFLATFTNVGFPFSSNPKYPVNQRIFIQHVQRKFNGLSYEDSYIGIVPIDRTGLSHLRPIAELNISRFKPLPCSEQPYCGWPFYLPLISHMNQVYYFPTPKLNFRPEVVVRFNNVTRRSGFTHVNFTYTGPEYMSIYVSPCQGYALSKWNIGSGTPRPTHLAHGMKGPQYFIFAAFGTIPLEPNELNLTLKAEGDSDCIVRLAVVGHHMPMDDRPNASPVLGRYLRHMPDWTSVIHMTSVYESWTIN